MGRGGRRLPALAPERARGHGDLWLERGREVMTRWKDHTLAGPPAPYLLVVDEPRRGDLSVNVGHFYEHVEDALALAGGCFTSEEFYCALFDLGDDHRLPVDLPITIAPRLTPPPAKRGLKPELRRRSLEELCATLRCDVNEVSGDGRFAVQFERSGSRYVRVFATAQAVCDRVAAAARNPFQVVTISDLDHAERRPHGVRVVAHCPALGVSAEADIQVI